jgi:hypothetical protein
MYIYCTYFMLHKYTTVCPIQILNNIFVIHGNHMSSFGCFLSNNYHLTVTWWLLITVLLFHSNGCFKLEVQLKYSCACALNWCCRPRQWLVGNDQVQSLVENLSSTGWDPRMTCLASHMTKPPCIMLTVVSWTLCNNFLVWFLKLGVVIKLLWCFAEHISLLAKIWSCALCICKLWSCLIYIFTDNS